MSDLVINFLNKHKWVQEEQKKVLGKAYQDNNLVFAWEDGRPIDPNLVTKWFRETAKKIGLTGRGLQHCAGIKKKKVQIDQKQVIFQ